MRLVGIELTFGIDQSYFILITPEIQLGVCVANVVS